jgi:hypothetical protein
MYKIDLLLYIIMDITENNTMSTSLAVDSLAVDSLAVDSLAVDSLAVDSLAVDSLHSLTVVDVIANMQECLHHRYSFANDRSITEYFERNFRWCVPDDLKRTLDNYYYGNHDDASEVQNAQTLLRHSEQYAEMLEQHILAYFSSFKNKIRVAHRDIQRTLREKGDYTIHLHESSILHTDIERSCLNRLSDMPDDVVRLVSEFALTPLLQYKLIKSECGDLISRLNRLKLQNLKKFGRVVYSYAHKINRYLVQSILPVCSIKKMCNISNLNMKLQSNNKDNIIQYIIGIMICCDEVIHNFVRRGKYPKTRKWLMLKTGYLYKSIMFVSRPEFNSRKNKK